MAASTPLGYTFQPGTGDLAGGGAYTPKAPQPSNIKVLNLRLDKRQNPNAPLPLPLMQGGGGMDRLPPTPAPGGGPPRQSPAPPPLFNLGDPAAGGGGGRSTPGQGEWAGLNLMADLGGGWTDQHNNTHPWDLGTPEPPFQMAPSPTPEPPRSLFDEGRMTTMGGPAAAVMRPRTLFK